jgi:hypothetical protein
MQKFDKVDVDVNKIVRAFVSAILTLINYGLYSKQEHT